MEGKEITIGDIVVKITIITILTMIIRTRNQHNTAEIGDIVVKIKLYALSDLSALNSITGEQNHSSTYKSFCMDYYCFKRPFGFKISHRKGTQ